MALCVGFKSQSTEIGLADVASVKMCVTVGVQDIFSFYWKCKDALWNCFMSISSTMRCDSVLLMGYCSAVCLLLLRPSLEEFKLQKHTHDCIMTAPVQEDVIMGTGLLG